jgi:hypothetical protein
MSFFSRLFGRKSSQPADLGGRLITPDYKSTSTYKPQFDPETRLGTIYRKTSTSTLKKRLQVLDSTLALTKNALFKNSPIDAFFMFVRPSGLVFDIYGPINKDDKIDLVINFGTTDLSVDLSHDIYKMYTIPLDTVALNNRDDNGESIYNLAKMVLTIFFDVHEHPVVKVLTFEEPSS